MLRQIITKIQKNEDYKNNSLRVVSNCYFLSYFDTFKRATNSLSGVT